MLDCKQTLHFSREKDFCPRILQMYKSTVSLPVPLIYAGYMFSSAFSLDMTVCVCKVIAGHSQDKPDPDAFSVPYLQRSSNPTWKGNTCKWLSGSCFALGQTSRQWSPHQMRYLCIATQYLMILRVLWFSQRWWVRPAEIRTTLRYFRREINYRTRHPIIRVGASFYHYWSSTFPNCATAPNGALNFMNLPQKSLDMFPNMCSNI